MLNTLARLTLRVTDLAAVARLGTSPISTKAGRLPATRAPRRLASMLGWLLLVVASTPIAADEPDMRLRLKDGSFSGGTLVGSPEDDRIGWRNDIFERPFAFDAASIRSLTRVVDSTGNSRPAVQAAASAQSPDATTADKGRGEQVIEMVDGGAVVGTLVGMDDTWITLESPTLGTVQVARHMALAVSDASYSGQVVYSGPPDESHWQRLGDASDWDFEAGVLVARRPGAAIVGEVQLPAQAQIDISLSWSGTPDFVLSLGTLASNRVSKVEEVPSAARLEVWANQLALVREVDGGADIAMLAELNSVNPRVELILYLDQEQGTIVACDTHGRALETLHVAGDDPKVRTAVHLANSGPSLTVERFEVRQWDGVIATVAEAGGPLLLDSNGQATVAGIVGFEAETNELRLALSDGAEQRLPLDQLRRGSVTQVATPRADSEVRVADASQTNASGDAENDAEKGNSNQATDQPQVTPAERATSQPAADDTAARGLEVVLMDRTRLKGRLLASASSDELRFEAVSISGVLNIPIAAVRGVIGNASKFVAHVVEQPVGTLKSEQQQLSGHLEPSNDGDYDGNERERQGSAALVWHPQGSSTASPLNPTASGSIAYRSPLPLPVPQSDDQASQSKRVALPVMDLFLGRGPAAADAAQPQAATKTGANQGKDTAAEKFAQARELLFRTGDAVDGVVEQIDESGMHFRSQQTDTQFVTHDLIQHVWLNKISGAAATSPEKLKRLMTIPRSLKQDPPTHLFIAVDGDYLRGRLVSLKEGKLIVEIRLETVELEASSIAQIVWLHDRDWQQKESAAAQDAPVANDADDSPLPAEVKADAEPADSAAPFLVHAIGRTERGLTFQPLSVTQGRLSGMSDLLGQCSIDVADINQLLFGTDVPRLVRAYRDNPWTLSLAQLPRVYLDDGGDASSDSLGDASPLLGQAATDFTLQSLAGDKFHLQSHRDRVVVLDFWASWCGPCVQTMPLVEQAVADLGGDKIQLVAINIQEPAARVQAAVERLQMSSTVLLDADGQVAAAYQANAIPQTVIIDRAGKVTHVFVGGGARFVAQFKQALETVVSRTDDGAPVDTLK